MKWRSLEGVVVRRGQQYYRGCGVPSSAVGGGHFRCLTSSPLMSHRLSTESLQFCPNPLFSDFVLYCAAAVRDLPVTIGPLIVALAMVCYSLGPSGFYIKGQLSRLCFCIVASQQQNMRLDWYVSISKFHGSDAVATICLAVQFCADTI